jgi:prophage maintenance system killer protein
MNKIEYPDKNSLEFWIKVLKEGKGPYVEMVRPYLPLIDAQWKDKVLGLVSLIQSEFYQPEILHRKAALIFYKINKGHNSIDSNKRSAILIVYFFYFLNSHLLYPPNRVRLLAKRVAKSKGRKQENNWIKKIEKFFSERVIRVE